MKSNSYSHDMNYKKIYDQLIARAKNENRLYKTGIYYERHHIVPKCLGGSGKYSQWNTHYNIVLLNAKEHFLAHLLLCEIYKDCSGLRYALWAMINQNRNGKRYKISSRTYNRIKLESIKIMSETRKGRPSHNKGKPNPGASLHNKNRPRPDLSERNRQRKGLPRNIKPGWVSPLKGKKQDPNLIKRRAEGRKSKGRHILQFNLDGSFVQEHRCMSEAYDWLKSLKLSGDIRSNLNGLTKRAGKYIWKYKEN